MYMGYPLYDLRPIFSVKYPLEFKGLGFKILDRGDGEGIGFGRNGGKKVCLERCHMIGV